MARRSQCSSVGDNPLDPNYLPPHYREEYRLAVDALIEAGLEGYFELLHKDNVVDFLSQPELEYITCTVQGPRSTTQLDRNYGVGDADGSSDTYWPVHSDIDAPALDLGWPQQHRFVGPTEITTLVNPSEPEMPSIKEQARRMIKNAQQVIAVAMDMFTDVDIFADILNAALRNIAVYVLLDDLNAQHFVAMVNNFRVNLDEIKFMRVRTVSGSTYFCHTGKFFKGQMMNCFMLVDCKVVLSGNYSFMWSFEKIHRCIAHVFLGQLVTTFDKEFRILYAQSEPLVTDIPLRHVEDSGNSPERHLKRESMHMFEREYPPINDIHAEWPRPFEDHMNVNTKILPFRRGESIQSSTEGNLPFQMLSTQHFRGEQAFLDHRKLMTGLNTKEMSDFQRVGYTGLPTYVYASPQKNAMNSGRQQMEGIEIQGTHFARDQYYNQRTGPEFSYGKSRDYSYHQFTGPDCHQIDNQDPPGDYDHVHRYLQSCPAVEAEPTGNLSVPVHSIPSRQSTGQSYAWQTLPTQQNPPDQKCLLNVHHKQQEQKGGLRDWRINSYLTALQYGGQNNMTDLQQTDPHVNIPYVIQERPCDPEISEIKQDNSESAKMSTSRLNPLHVPSTNSLTLPENSANLLDNCKPCISNAQITTLTTSESSYITEVDKVKKIQNRDHKKTNLIREDFFRRRPNLPVQRSSRLKHSLIFNANIEQDTSEEIRNSSSEKNAEKPVKYSHLISNIFEGKKSVTKEPYQWRDSDSTVSEDILNKTEQNSVGDEPNQILIKDAQQEISHGPQCIELQDVLAENSKMSLLPPTALQRPVSLEDMNDHQRRLENFKGLFTKHKKHALVEVPKPIKEKDPKECDKKTPLYCNLAEQIKSDLKNRQTPQTSRETLLTTPQKLLGDGFQDSIPKQPGLLTLPDKHIKHTFAPEFKIAREITSVGKCDSSSKVIPDTATDAEKIQHIKTLIGGCDSSSNRVHNTRATNMVVELGAKPKLISQLITNTDTKISSPMFVSAKSKLSKNTESVASNLPSVISQNNSELTSADSISSHGITFASIFPKNNTIQTSSPLRNSEELLIINATATNTCLLKDHATKETVCFLHSTPIETDFFKHNIPLTLSHSHFTPVEGNNECPIVPPANTKTTATDQHSTLTPLEAHTSQPPTATETVPSAQTTITATDQYSTLTPLEAHTPLPPTPTETVPSAQTTITAPDQHSTLTPLEAHTSQPPTPTETVPSAQTTTTATDQHSTLTPLEAHTPQPPTATETVPSAQTTITATDQHSTLTPLEANTLQASTATETVPSAQTTIIATDQHSTLTPLEAHTPQPPPVTETVPSAQTTITASDQHSTLTPLEAHTPHPPTPTETVPFAQTTVTATDQHSTLTPLEAHTTQPPPVTETVPSAQTTITATDQHSTLTPLEANTLQPPTPTETVPSAQTTVTSNDQHSTLTPLEAHTPQPPTPTETVPSAQTTVTATDQHYTLTPLEAHTTQPPPVIETVPSAQTTITATDQHSTLTPLESHTAQPSTVTETVPFAQTTITATDQHSTLTPLEANTPQPPTPTETVPSAQTTITATDQHSTLTPLEAHTPQPPPVTETVPSAQTTITATGQHSTLTPLESNTLQAPTATETVPSAQTTITATDQHSTLTPLEAHTPQPPPVTETVPSAQTTITATGQHSTLTPLEAHTSQPPPVTETVPSAQTTITATGQHSTLSPLEANTLQAPTATETVPSAQTTITATDQHSTLTPLEAHTPQPPPVTETVPSAQTTITATGQHSTLTPLEAHTSQPPTATETVPSAQTTVTATDQHSTLTPLESHTAQPSTVTETVPFAQTTITATDQHSTLTPLEANTPQPPTPTETVPSAQTTITATDQHSTLTPLEAHTPQPPPVTETVPSAQTTITATGQHSTLTPLEANTLQAPTATETVPSAQTTITATDQHSTLTPLEAHTPQPPPVTETVPSAQTTITATGQHSTLTPLEAHTPQPPPVTETVPSAQTTITATGQHSTLTPLEAHTSQPPTATETVPSAQTTITATDQHSTLTPLEAHATQPPPVIETVPSAQTTVTSTDQHSTLTPLESHTAQPSTVTETVPSAQTTITATDQHSTLTPLEANTLQAPTATETVPSTQTTITATDQHSTLTPLEANTPQPPTPTETVPSAQTTVISTDQHSTLTPLEVHTPQPPTPTETVPSAQTTVTATDQHSTLTPLEVHSPQPPTAAEAVSFLHTAAIDKHPTPAPSETDFSKIDTPQHLSVTETTSSQCDTVAVTNQCPALTLPESITPAKDMISSLHSFVAVTEQHPTPTPSETDTPQHLSITETTSSLYNTVAVTDQDVALTPRESLIPQHANVPEIVSSGLTTITATEQLPTPAPGQTDIPQDSITTETDSSLQTTVTVMDQYHRSTPSVIDTLAPSSAAVMVSSAKNTLPVIDQHPLPEADTLEILPRTEPYSSLQTTITIADQCPTEAEHSNVTEISTEQNLISARVQTDTIQDSTATEMGCSQQTIVKITKQHPTPTLVEKEPVQHPAETKTISSIHAAITITGQHPIPSPDTPQPSTSTEMISFSHTFVTFTDQHPTPTRPEIDTTSTCAEYPVTKESVSSLHSTETQTDNCQDPTSIEPEHSQHSDSTKLGHSQHTNSTEPGYSQYHTSAETGHSQYSASGDTFHAEQSAATEKISSVYTTDTNQPSIPPPEKMDITQHSTEIDTVSYVYTTVKVTEKDYTPTPPEIDTPQSTPTDTTLSAVTIKTVRDQHCTPSPAETDTPQQPTATQCKHYGPVETESSADTSSYQHPTPTISITSTSEKVKCSFGEQSTNNFSSDISPIHRSKVVGESCLSLLETCSIRNTLSQNVSLIGTTSSTEHSQCAPSEYNSTPSSRQTESTSEVSDAQPKQSPSLNQTQSDNGSTHCLLDPNPCPHNHKTKENIEENQRAPIKKQKTVKVANVGLGNADHSQNPQCNLTQCTDFVVQQEPLASQKSILSSFQSSTANVLSCSNLRDDTKVLLEQISAKNQGRVSSLTDDAKEGEINGNRNKQTSGHQMKTWSSKATPEDRQKLLKRIESMRKERKVYSRFEAS